MESNLDVVRRTYVCGKEGDMEGFVRNFAHDVRWTEMAGAPYAGTFVGPKAIAEGVFGPMNRDWAPFACEPLEFFESGDLVLMLGRYFGKNQATQKPFEARVAHVWRLEQGKVKSFEQFTDTRLIWAAMT